MPDPSRPPGGSRLPAPEGRERRAFDGEARAPRADGWSLRETPSLQLLESFPDAVVVVDGDGLIRQVNGQVERCFGFGRSDLIGQPVEALIPERFHERHRAASRRFLADPQVLSMGASSGFVGRRKDGSEFPAEISLGPMRTREGVFVVAVCRDVTRQREAALSTTSRGTPRRTSRSTGCATGTGATAGSTLAAQTPLADDFTVVVIRVT